LEIQYAYVLCVHIPIRKGGVW